MKFLLYDKVKYFYQHFSLVAFQSRKNSFACSGWGIEFWPGIGLGLVVGPGGGGGLQLTLVLGQVWQLAVEESGKTVNLIQTWRNFIILSLTFDPGCGHMACWLYIYLS